MNKNITLLFALLLTMSLNAQVMRIYKGTTLVGTYTAAEADKVVFEPQISVQSIELDPTTATLNLGMTLKIAATVSPQDASIPTLTWTSSNPDIASVQDGVVTGLAVGEATITCEANDGSGTKATCTINVVNNGMNICVGFYETIPGYSVKDLTLTYGNEIDNGDNHVILMGESEKYDFGKLINYFPAELNEPEGSYLSRSASNATKTEYLSIDQNVNFVPIHFIVSFKLIATDGSGEVITVNSVPVNIPENLIEYRSGNNCAILFNIHYESEWDDIFYITTDVFYERPGGGGGTR